MLSSLLRSMRPRQWVKNVLVLAAPLFSGRIGEPDVLLPALGSFVCFCLISSAVYLFNDVRDLNEDRAHPRKRNRPVAAGTLPVRTAMGASLLLGALALTGAAAISGALAGVIATYAGVNLAYSTFLKNEPVIDIGVIAGGFVLRAVAGSAAAAIELSQWFLLIATFGSLFMAAGKRYAEVRQLGEGHSETRRSLARYTSTYLRFVWSMSAGALIMSYALWAFEIGEATEEGLRWSEISIAPFILAVLRYAVDVDAGRASEPEEIAFTDRALLSLALVWLMCVALAVY
jgi:decaprenyl-phosphate phosphoribosyltransferase